MPPSSTGLTPVHFFSHGSTMMLGEECDSASYWKKCGDEALENGIKGVVIMVCHFLQTFSHLRLLLSLSTALTRFPLPGCALGLPRRQDRSRHKPHPFKIACRLRPPLQIRRLRPQSRPPYRQPLRLHAPICWLQCQRKSKI
jgi:hypothetical protein